MTATQASLYEHLFPLTTIMKQRVLDNFDGDTLNERWFEKNNTGTGTFVIVDAIGEGFSVKAGGTVSDDSLISFNNIRQYDSDNSEFIIVCRRSSNGLLDAGCSENDSMASGTDGAFMRNNNADTFYKLVTVNVGNTQADTTINTDTSFHNHKVKNTSANSTLDIDDILEVTNTTNLPTDPVQPIFRSFTAAGPSSPDCRIKYLEVFNI